MESAAQPDLENPCAPTIHLRKLLGRKWRCETFPGCRLAPEDWGDTNWGVPLSQIYGTHAPQSVVWRPKIGVTLSFVPTDWGDTETFPGSRLAPQSVVWRPKIGVTLSFGVHRLGWHRLGGAAEPDLGDACPSENSPQTALLGPKWRCVTFYAPQIGVTPIGGCR